MNTKEIIAALREMSEKKDREAVGNGNKEIIRESVILEEAARRLEKFAAVLRLG